MKGKVVFAMFSEAKIELMMEIREHWPELGATLVMEQSKEWPDQLAIIAAYCKIMMDGMYSMQQLEDLTDKLVWELRAKRGALVIKPSIGIKLTDAISPPAMPGNDTKH